VRVAASRAGRKYVPSRDVAASNAGAVVFSFALGIATVAVPLLALRAGYSAAEIGAVTAVSAVAQMLARLSLGPAMRRWPDWTLITAAGFLLTASNGLMALSATVVPLVVANLLQGVARACFFTGTQTHVVRGPGSAVGALATMNFVGSAGLLAGPVVAGVLSERTPVLALTVATGIALLGTIPTFLLDRHPPFSLPADRPPGQMWRRPGVNIGCWAAVTAGSWRGMLSSFIPVALDSARHSSSTIGLLVTVANGAALAGAAVVGRVRERGTRWAFVVGTLAAGIGTALSAALAENVVLAAIVLAISGLGAGALQTVGPAIATDSVHPEERGEAIATAGTFRAAALFAAPLAVSGLVGIIALAPAMALVGVAMTVPAIALRRRSRVPEAAA
jgi:MFS family permease